MNYEVYRNTTLGNTLQEVLDELVQVDCDCDFGLGCAYVCASSIFTYMSFVL